MSEKFIQFSESFKQGFKKFWLHVAAMVATSAILFVGGWTLSEIKSYKITQAVKASKDSLFEARVLSFITYEKKDSSDHEQIKDSVRQLRADMNVCFKEIANIKTGLWPYGIKIQ